MTKFLNISTDNTLGGNSPSNETVSSQKAIKDYVDNNSGGSPAWGNIRGTLSDQTDLQNALNAKANDSDVVKLAGNQTISGLKQFQIGTIDGKVGNNSADLFRLRVKDQYHSSAYSDVWMTRNEGGTDNGTAWSGFRITDTSGNIIGQLSIIKASGGNVIYTSAPTPATSDNSTKIATTAFVKAQGYTSNVGTITGIKMNGASKGTSGVVDLGTVLTSHQSLSNYVTLNGDQTITATKTLQNKNLAVKNTVADDEASSISGNVEYGMVINDKNGSRIGNFYGGQRSNGQIRTYMCACRPVNGTMKYQYADIQQNVDGTGNFNISCNTATAPTPATSDNSTKIATTAFVKNQGYVSSSSLTTVHVVTQTYVNGTSWYRVWSDGWCEQGGVITNATYGGVDVTLLKSYKNTNYTGFVTLRRDSNDGQGDINPQFYPTSVSVAKIGGGYHNSSNCQWYACGYIS